MTNDSLPSRIVCLTGETVETLYLLGEENRVVAVTGYAVRPARARREKPRVGAFVSADVAKILALDPDLVLTYSDLQADIVADLVRAGVEVHAFNQRDLAGIYAMIRTLGRLVGAENRAVALAGELEAGVERIRAAAPAMRPRVYFEEWDDPMISGIKWVSELIEAAGGTDVFAELASGKSATERFVTVEQVAAARPDVIVGSWCGKKFVPDRVRARPGFADLPAVRHGRLHEVKSSLVLTPGPAALTDGLAALRAVISSP